MKAECIIAARGELPENLSRTTSALITQCPVTVVLDGDEVEVPSLPAGVEIVRPWLDVRGCGQARHYGIVESDADVVILMDGHMAAPPDLVRNIVKHLGRKANAKHLCCTHMQSLRHNWTALDEAVYAGAFLAEYTTRDNVLNTPFAVKWNKRDIGKGLIGAVCGACYAMRREWYDKIGQPLRVLEYWGGDEEILSLATHLCYGGVWLLPDVCGHVYAAPHRGRVKPPDHNARIAANDAAIVLSVPMSAEDSMAMLDYIAERCADFQALLPMDRDARCSDVQAILGATGLSLPDLRAGRLVRRLTPDEQAADRRRRAPGIDDVRELGNLPARATAQPAAQPTGNDWLTAKRQTAQRWR